MIFCLKNPEKGAHQFIQTFFSRSRIFGVSFTYQSVSFYHKIKMRDNDQSKYTTDIKPQSQFKDALIELTNNCNFLKMKYIFCK